MTHTLTADSIQLEFGLRPILSDIYLHCQTGKITGLLGRNGQGKTCLMRAIYGDQTCSSRSVRFDDTAVLHPYTRPDLVRYLPQFNFIPGSLTLKRVFTDFNLGLRELENILYQDILDISDRLYVLLDGRTRLAKGTEDLETSGYLPRR